MQPERNDMRGTVTLELRDRSGTVVARQRRHNRIVLTGRQLVAQGFAGVITTGATTEVTHVGIGTDPTAPADHQTALLAERIGRRRIQQVSYTDIVDGTGAAAVSRSRASLTAVFDFDEANGSTPLCEAGLFTAATGGVMYNRVVFDEVHKTQDLKLTVLWDVIF